MKWRATGRGRNFSVLRGGAETLCNLVYSGGWPARVLAAFPSRVTVDLVEHQLPALPARQRSGSGGDGSTARAGGPSAAGAPARELRIVFASDLHIGPLTPPALLDNAFARMAEARPDVLILGGDYVFLEATPAHARELEARVAAVPAAVKLAVLGNHDLWTYHGLLEDALLRAGARVLINQAHRLAPPFDDVAIVGLDDPWTGEPDAARAVADAGDAAVRIGVAHSPEVVPMLAGRDIALLMCGHTHGGQIALPSGPVVVHGKHGRMYPAGLFDVGPMKLFVSRGLGAVDLPLRAYARPDVALLTFTRRDA